MKSVSSVLIKISARHRGNKTGFLTWGLDVWCKAKEEESQPGVPGETYEFVSVSCTVLTTLFSLHQVSGESYNQDRI